MLIYQIYPRSFMDANNDGVGDLKGITEKLDYIATLGVDAVWISPFFKSPMKDFGYDVSDYCDVDPLFGTMKDFDVMMKKAKKLGLKIFIDQVWSHTSDQHPWFKESRSSRSNKKADWYVWADAKPDGTPPNNWLSIFGGPSWTWDSKRRQYYFHNFLTSQPDLNLHNPEVVDAVLKAGEFWVKKGVSGFRVDAVPHFLHDPKLRNNPTIKKRKESDTQTTVANPRALQNNIYNVGLKELFPLTEKIRKFYNKYPDVILLGEVLSGQDTLKEGAKYTGPKRFHMVYTGDLIVPDLTASQMKDILTRVEKYFGNKAPGLCWSIGSHDVTRVRTRWDMDGKRGDNFFRMIAALVLSLNGSFCLYQGDELGLTEADIPFELMQDPYGITFYPEYKGRDGCRTPMPWQSSAKHGGFSKAAKTWLPVPKQHLRNAANTHEKNQQSFLNTYRSLIRLRKTLPALQEGSLQLLASNKDVLAFIRSHGKEKLLCLFNFSASQQKFLSANSVRKLITPLPNGGKYKDNQFTLEPYGVIFVKI